MKWLDSKPEGIGNYWFKGVLGDADSEIVRLEIPTVVEIVDNGGLFAKIPGRHWWFPVSSAVGKWAGPLECPE